MNRSSFQLILITAKISFGLGVRYIYLILLQNISEDNHPLLYCYTVLLTAFRQAYS